MGIRRGPTLRRPRESRVTHDARYDRAAVHFTMTTQVDGKLDIRRSTRRLLDSHVAISAAWPSEDKIRVSRYARSQARSLRRARSMYEHYVKADGTRSWASGIGFAIKHPRLGYHHLRALWAPRVLADIDALLKNKTLTGLVVFSVKHPTAAVRYVLPNVRLSRGPELKESPTNVDELLHSGEDEPAPSVEEDDGDPLEPLNEAERLIIDQQIVSAAERFTDRRIFGGRSHDEDRFVRLQLRNSYHDFVVPGESTSQHVVFEPRLLLHESGAVQLDLTIRAEGPLSTDQILGLMWGPAPRIVRSEMSTPLLAGSGWEPLVVEIGEELDVGKPLAVIDHEFPASMTEASKAHLGAVMTVLRRQTTYWVNYPVALVQPASCCSPERWRSNHSQEVHRLAVRGRGTGGIASHVERPPDLSMHPDHSLFANLGSAVYLQWDGEIPTGIEELDTVLVLDYALLTYVRLQTMEWKVSKLALGERVLTRRYRDALELFSELRQGNVRAGEARDIIRHVLADAGADQMRSTIETALSLAGTAHETVSASRASRRSWWITVFATLIAALVAVPAVQQLIDSAAALSSSAGSGPFVAPLLWAGSLGFWGPWALMGTVVALVGVLMTLGWIWRHRPGHLPSLRRGYAWPNRIMMKGQPPDFEFSAAKTSEDATRTP